MATFGEGPKELTDRLKEAKADLNEAEYTRIEQAIANYASTRNDVLSAMFDTLSNTGDDEKKSEYNDRFSTARERVMSTLTGMLDGLPTPSPDAVLLRTQAAVEEAALFKGLESCNLGSARDLLLLFKVRLKDMIDVLHATWDTTTAEDQRIEEIERRAAEDMNRILQKTIEDGIAAYAQIGRASYEVVEALKGFPAFAMKVVVESVRTLIKQAEAAYPNADASPRGWSDSADLIEKMSDPGKELFETAKAQGMEAREVAKMVPYLARNPALVVGDWIDDAVKALGNSVVGPNAGSSMVMALRILGEGKKFTFGLLYPWSEARQRYTDQLPNEGLILACFSKSRKQVDEFIRDNGIEAAKDHLELIEADLDKWRSGVPDRMKTDADEFTVMVKDALGRRISELEGLFTQFVNENRGRFIGEVDKVTTDKLVDLDNWSSKREGMVGLGLDQRLRDWRAQTIAVEASIDDAWSQVQGAVASLPVAFQDALRRRLNDYYSGVKSQLAAARVDLVDGLDQTARAVEPDQIRKVFDRTSLQRALTS